LAQAQNGASQFLAAEASLEKVLELEPDFVDAKVALASFKAKRGKYQDALKMANELQKAYPKSPTGLDLEGNINMMQAHYAQAIRAYEAAAKLADSTTLTLQLFNAYVQAGRQGDADALLLKRLKKFPKDVKLRLHLALAYMKQRKYEQAVSQYNTVLSNTPKDVVALNNLAWAYFQLRDDRALSVAEHAYKVNPKSAQAADTLGWILVKFGHLKRGLSILKTANAALPGSPTIAYHYAAALAKAGDKAQARKQLEALLKKAKAFPELEEAKKLLGQM